MATLIRQPFPLQSKSPGEASKTPKELLAILTSPEAGYSTYPIALIRWLDRQLTSLKLSNPMKIVHLKHFAENDKQSLGVITVDLGMELFVAKTLELGWHDNKSNVSRIPAGRYLCRWTRSNRLSTLAGHDVFTYEVLGVPGRAGIRIHSANYFFQLLGCIAIGDVHKDINADGQLDTAHSGVTLGKFNTKMNKEDFWLEIAA